MNWSKNVYTFMLGAIIVLSGCMGAGTTDGQDAEDSGDLTAGTTVINNYYWNNTTEVITEIPEMFSTGGLIAGQYATKHIQLVNTSAGEMIQIHLAQLNEWPTDTLGSFDILSNCSLQNIAGMEFLVSVDGIGTLEEAFYPGYVSSAGPYYLPGSTADCTHTMRISLGGSFGEGGTLNTEGSWSLVYSIVPVTVV